MEETFEIKNKIAESGLINFDIASLVPVGKRVGLDIKDFLFQELILKEKDFREKVENLDPTEFQDTYVYVYNSVDAIVPLWAYFLIASKLTGHAKKVIFGNEKDLEVLLLHEAIESTDFSTYEGKRMLVKGCSDFDIPENAYIELVQKLKPIAKSMMFGEACSNVPIFKNKAG
ncbi:DUF2480 family protein [Chryseobacterium sp. A301]